MNLGPRILPTECLPASPDSIALAASLIRSGELVAFPTETVYGLGANATDENAVAAIFGAKERPKFNPLIVHVGGIVDAKRYAKFNGPALKLADAFWPGALTLVLHRRRDRCLAELATAGLETVAIRSPAHPVARELLAAADMPIAAPSANRSGNVSPTMAEHVLEELGGRIPLVLDGGACTSGLESTIVGFDDGQPILLRKGSIPRDAIEDVVGPLGTPVPGGVSAPGMMQSHYAPQTKVRLNAISVKENEALLAFGPNIPETSGPVRNLSEAGDLREAASNLFRMLRELDKTGAATIAVMPIPEIRLGEAINDRLARASAPSGR
jgi:L-threonylcarbamoyladenylate synthase